MDAGLRELEREVRVSPSDGELRERLRAARRRVFGFDWEDPVVAIARDNCVTSSSVFLDVPGLDVSKEIARRPEQPWFVQFAAEVRTANPIRFGDTPPSRRVRVHIGIAVDGKNDLANQTGTEPSSLGGWSRLNVGAWVSTGGSISARWCVEHGAAVMRFRSIVAVPVEPVDPASGR